ncbi:MAG: glycosyltransferase family 2 protein [Candidatus Viridilinea halotolerans]|uniref:Glycosyltransferase family 2 protein n=1 Tax=Candidatus Viridilinea halotolerans TaxID=2491704 RepID=A0A426U1Q2_9CHLR|nr:MAG: glycosyltransferase family 2 protein [Candidatus Viridilinea halotolerans]
MPRVSVILPTYNRAHLLPRAITSVLQQRMADLELIVVDDGSNDATEALVAGMQDRRLRYVRHQQRRGAAAARNTGISLSRGQFLAFQDSDDAWLPQKLTLQLARLAHAPAHTGVVYCRFWQISGTQAQLVPSRLHHAVARLPFTARRLEGWLGPTLLHGNFITTQSALVKRECIERHGAFDSHMPRFQDWDLWLRLAPHYSFAYVSAPLLNAYVTSDSISKDDLALQAGFALLIAKYGHRQAGYGLAAQRHYVLGQLARAVGDKQVARQHFNAALKLHPCNPTYAWAFGQTLLKHLA